MLPPAAPSALPEEKIGRLTIACPADVQVRSIDGGPVSIGFRPPSTTGGQPPVVVSCTHEPGHGFSVGTTEVSCNAADALRQTAGCGFRVSVLAPPRIAKTRFLAFGDSLTKGWVSPPSARARTTLGPGYPHLLWRRLLSRYTAQIREITVFNEGARGERASAAESRFRAVVARRRPEVVLLMHGTNDLDLASGAGAEAAADAIRSMVRHAQDVGADVVLMTIPPHLRPGAVLSAEDLNKLIRLMAARLGVELVDVHELVQNGSCPGRGSLPCLGSDGIHLTAEGYELLARELARVVMARYELPADGRTGQPPAPESGAEGAVSFGGRR